MPIGLDTEHIITLKEAKNLVPTRRKPQVATMRRWCAEGVYDWYTGGRIRLEHVRIGGVIHTSKEALKRFMESTSAMSPTV